MTDPTLKAYIERWQAVEEVEKREQRTASIALRWQQTNSIFGLAIGLGLSFDEQDDQEEFVRSRWTKLRGNV